MYLTFAAPDRIVTEQNIQKGNTNRDFEVCALTHVALMMSIMQILASQHCSAILASKLHKKRACCTVLLSLFPIL